MPWHLKYDDQVPRGTWNMMIKCRTALEMCWSSATALDFHISSAARHLIIIFQVPCGTWSSYFKCHAALGHHISSATALDEWCNITMYYILSYINSIYYLHSFSLRQSVQSPNCQRLVHPLATSPMAGACLWRHSMFCTALQCSIRHLNVKVLRTHVY